jgi:serine protease Do
MMNIVRYYSRGLGLLAVLCSLALAAPAPAQDVPAKDSSKFLAAFRDVVRKASDSTAKIVCDGKQVALGTIVGKEGYVLTKASELKDKPVCKLFDGRSLEAKVVGVHEVWDLALLKVEAKDLKPAEWRESKTDTVGSWVASAGLDIDPVAVGVISVASRNIAPAQIFRPGGTGGGFLGVSLEQIEGGVKIGDVTADSAAMKAGVKLGDIVESIEGTKIEDVDSMIDLVSSHKPGDTIVLKVKRGKEEMELKATLGKRPAAQGSARADFQNNLGSKLSTRKNGFPTILQHDTVLKTTDCGGPLVDLDGKVIGVNIARAGRVDSVAIPAEVVQTLLPELMSGKLVPVATTKALEEKVQAAKDVLKKAEEALAAVTKKLTEAKTATDKVEQEKVAAEKSLQAAKDALRKLEEEAKAATKP